LGFEANQTQSFVQRGHYEQVECVQQQPWHIGSNAGEDDALLEPQFGYPSLDCWSQSAISDQHETNSAIGIGHMAKNLKQKAVILLLVKSTHMPDNESIRGKLQSRSDRWVCLNAEGR
jgi:hypothetical protein